MSRIANSVSRSVPLSLQVAARSFATQRMTNWISVFGMPALTSYIAMWSPA